jgi:preprotein translocase subunit SecF
MVQTQCDWSSKLVIRSTMMMLMMMLMMILVLIGCRLKFHDGFCGVCSMLGCD